MICLKHLQNWPSVWSSCHTLVTVVVRGTRPKFNLRSLSSVSRRCLSLATERRRLNFLAQVSTFVTTPVLHAFPINHTCIDTYNVLYNTLWAYSKKIKGKCEVLLSQFTENRKMSTWSLFPAFDFQVLENKNSEVCVFKLLLPSINFSHLWEVWLWSYMAKDGDFQTPDQVQTLNTW